MSEHAAPPLLTLRGVEKKYGGRTVLDLPALDLSAGTRLALLGANGSGKSTLLRLLAGAIAPTRGLLTPGDPPPKIGYLPQKPYCFSCSALQNVLLATERGPRADRLARARQALESVGLTPLAQTRGDRLSGGESQRLGLARLLVRRWDLLLLDEPTAAADIAGAALLERAVDAYVRETGCALVFATHAVAQAERMSDTALFLDAGRPAEQGSTARLLHSPQSPELQAFLAFWAGT